MLQLRTVVLALTASLPLQPLLQTPLHGQAPVREPGRILGTVVDLDTGRGIQGVAVRILPPVDATVLTNREGRFTFTRVPPGIHELELSHIGYGTTFQLVNVPEDRTVQVRVAISPEAIDLGEVHVQVEMRNRSLEQEGYYSRRDFGFGRYFDREAMEVRTLSAALREVPRLRLEGRSAMSYTPVFTRGWGSCVPVIWIDRRMLRLRGAPLEAMVDRHNIEAMEVYRPGDTPGEFMYAIEDCGAIVIWTRSGNR